MKDLMPIILNYKQDEVLYAHSNLACKISLVFFSVDNIDLEGRSTNFFKQKPTLWIHHLLFLPFPKRSLGQKYHTAQPHRH